MRRWHAQNNAFNFSGLIAFVAFVPPIIFGVWLALGVQGRSLLWCDDVSLFLGAFGGSMMAFFAARRYAGTGAGRAWAAVGIGMLFMSFGEGAWAFQELILNKEVASPAVADIGYLAFYPAVFLGLLMMPQAPATGMRRAKLSLDLGVATGAVALISFHFVIAGLIAGSATLGDWITVAYPICDVFLVSAAIVLLVRGGRNVTTMNLGLLALGFAVIGVADSLYTYLSSLNNYNSGNYIDVGWMIAYGLIILAAAGAANRTINVDTFREDEEHAVPVWQSLALNAALIPVGAMLFMGHDDVVTAGFVSLVALSFGSHLLTHFEIGRLNAELSEMANVLRSKVRTERITSLLKTNREPGEDESVSAGPGPEAWPQDRVSERFSR
jgi:diguanylate cyclase